ncbi:MAG TPA: GntR family transcriptional regulator [Nocardioides sp.]|nr:GntR family transcriptional regulator [Nocardioides sp.]
MTERVQQTVPYSVQAADILRARILGGEYELGQRLSEVELSTSLGISRSPLREALRALANEGLVDLVSGRGVFVADFSPREVRELLEIREALDVLAIRLAAQRATDEQIEVLRHSLEGLSSALRSHGSQAPDWPSDFHLCIYEAAGNQRLKEQGWSIHTQIRLVRFRSGAAAERMERAHQEHLALLAAIEDHDPDAAEQRMREHLINSGKHILEQLAPAQGGGSSPR